MKQTYVKPVLVMENFTLNQSIAHNCGDNLDFSQGTLKDKSTCGWIIGDVDYNGTVDTVFMSRPSCSILTENYEGVCYNNPEGGYNVFNS